VAPTLTLVQQVMATRVKLRGSAKVYTREIPGAETMSQAELIKVSAKIKLRPSGMQRSPGGTPRKQRGGNAAAAKRRGQTEAPQTPANILSNALFKRLRHLRGKSQVRLAAND
jgi:hypothetical protein